MISARDIQAEGLACPDSILHKICHMCGVLQAAGMDLDNLAWINIYVVARTT
jgi:hypothetical protein